MRIKLFEQFEQHETAEDCAILKCKDFIYDILIDIFDDHRIGDEELPLEVFKSVRNRILTIKIGDSVDPLNRRIDTSKYLYNFEMLRNYMEGFSYSIFNIIYYVNSNIRGFDYDLGSVYFGLDKLKPVNSISFHFSKNIGL